MHLHTEMEDIVNFDRKICHNTR